MIPKLEQTSKDPVISVYQAARYISEGGGTSHYFIIIIFEDDYSPNFDPLLERIPGTNALEISASNSSKRDPVTGDPYMDYTVDIAGYRGMVLSAFPMDNGLGGTNKVSDVLFPNINEKKDLAAARDIMANLSIKKQENWVRDATYTGTDYDFFLNIMELAGNYDQQMYVNPIVYPDKLHNATGRYYNSNSFTATLLELAGDSGARHDFPGLDIGGSAVIPASYFKKPTIRKKFK